MSYRGTKRKRTDARGNYSKANGTSGQNRQANMPQHGFYGMKQPLIGAPNGLYNARYSASTRGPEKKFVDTQIVQGGLPKGWGSSPAAATFYLLNGVPQGTDYNNRVGRTVCFKSLTLNWAVSAETATLQVLPAITEPPVPYVEQTRLVRTELTFGVRVMIVYDRQPNGVFPDIDDLLYAFDNDGTTTPDAYNITTMAFNNLNNKDRFMVLLDKKFTVGSAGGNLGVFVKKHRRINLETQYNNTTGTITGIQTGAFYLLEFGEQQDNTSDVPNYAAQSYTNPDGSPGTVGVGLIGYWGCRMRYTDV